VYFIGRSEAWKKELRECEIVSTSSLSSSKTVAKGSELNIVLSLNDIGEKLDFLIICLKRTALSKVCEQIELDTCKDATIVTLMNRVRATDEIRTRLRISNDRTTIEGIWSTNIVKRVYEGINYHMGTSGYCYLQENERGKEQAAIFNHSCLETKVHPQMTGVQYGKLLMNRNNAINALSGCLCR
jgi:2-dehydropantoate 2-reductase